MLTVSSLPNMDDASSASSSPNLKAASGSSGSRDRLATDKLESDLWKWRSKCKKTGKKIPKRLVQARAKWAFQKQGLIDFKVRMIRLPCWKRKHELGPHKGRLFVFVSKHVIKMTSKGLLVNHISSESSPLRTLDQTFLTKTL